MSAARAAAKPPAAPAALREALFGDPSRRAYAVVDAAARENFHVELEKTRAPMECLLPGEPAPEEAAVAPWLVALSPDGKAMDLLEAGWGRAEAVYLLSPLPMAPLRGHARALCRAELPDRRAVLFRFYDPRVLRDVAPLLDAGQRREMFGGVIDAMLCEDESGTGLARFAP